MDSRQAVFIAVAAAVALGGVSFAVPGPSVPDTADFDVFGFDASASPTPTPGGGSTPTDEYFRFDGQQFNQTHYTRLARIGNFTTQSNMTVIRPDARRHYNVTYIVDLQDDTKYEAIDFRYEDQPGDAVPLIRKYEYGDLTHINRTRTGREPACDVYRAPYDDSQRPVNTSLALGVGYIATGVIDASNWTYTTNQTADGITLFRFDVDETRHFGVSTVPGTVTDGEATMVVGSDNILRYMEYDFTIRDGGNETRFVYRSFYSRLGDTHVAQPDWYPC